jgi:hypothetical protein
MARKPYSLDDKIERALNERGIEDVIVENGMVTAGPFCERISGVIVSAKLDALAERIKEATGAAP